MRISAIRGYGIEQNKMTNRLLSPYQTAPLKQDSVSFSGSIEATKAQEIKNIEERLKAKPINVVEAKNKFREIFNQESEVAAFAPGRVEFNGNHIDNYGGHVIGFPTDAGILTLAGHSDKPGRIVTLYSEKFGEYEFDLDEEIGNPIEYFNTPERKKQWSNITESTVRLLDKEYGPLESMNIYDKSNLPCTGISTSAASEVSAAHAVLGLQGKDDLSTEKIAELCKIAENNTGMGCGILDQGTIAVARGKDKGVLIDCQDKAIFENIPLEIPGHKLVFIVSGINHSNASTYMDFRKGYDAGAEILLSTFFPGKSKLCDVTPEEYNAVEKEFKTLVADPSDANKCKHGVMENQRVKDTVVALEKKDTKELARLLTESHISSRDNLGVSCPEIDAIHSLAMANGALGGRLSGAGWGGGAFFIVPEEKLPEFVGAMEPKYPKMFIFEANGGGRLLDENEVEV